MERRDLIKDQIEQLAKVLGLILSDFLGLKSKGDVEQAIETSNERFQKEAELDIEKILSFNHDELLTYTKAKELDSSHLEILARYLTQIGSAQTIALEKQRYLQKAINLLQIADELSKTFSFERASQLERIHALLNAGI